MIKLVFTVFQVITLRYSYWHTACWLKSILTLQSPPPPSPSSHQCPSSDIIPVCWGHVAELVRLNPNQYLSNGLRKVPNQVYAQLIQSACGGMTVPSCLPWFHFSRQAGRRAGLLNGVGAGGMPGATRHGWMILAPNTMAVRGFTGENKGPKPWTRGTGKERNELWQSWKTRQKRHKITAERKSWTLKHYITKQKTWTPQFGF